MPLGGSWHQVGQQRLENVLQLLGHHHQALDGLRQVDHAVVDDAQSNVEAINLLHQHNGQRWNLTLGVQLEKEKI